MKATQQLKDEHEGILIMLSIMENISNDLKKGKELDVIRFEKILEFIKGFADKCHHGKEEDILFPAMKNRNILKAEMPIEVMLREHKAGREYISSLSDAFRKFRSGNKSALIDIIQNISEYVQLLRNHIEKENSILFAIADQVLDEKTQSDLYEAFEILETEKIGAGKHEEYHHLLKELMNIYLK